MFMSIKKYKQIRLATFFFIISILLVSVLFKLYLLTIITVFTGIVFLSFAHTNNQNYVDEMQLTIQEKATDFTYSIFTPTLAITTFFLLIPTHSGLPVFSKGDFLFLETLGVIFAYLTLFQIILYSFFFLYLSKKFGGKQDEE